MHFFLSFAMACRMARDFSISSISVFSFEEGVGNRAGAQAVALMSITQFNLGKTFQIQLAYPGIYSSSSSWDSNLNNGPKL